MKGPGDHLVQLLHLLPHTDRTPIHLLIDLILDLIFRKEAHLQCICSISVYIREIPHHAIAQNEH